MKITKKKLKQIIKEELKEITLYNPQTGEPFELDAKHTSDFVKNMLGKPPSSPKQHPDTQVEEPDHKVLLIARSLKGVYPNKTERELYFLAQKALHHIDSIEDTVPGE